MKELLDAGGPARQRRKYPSQLSGGQQQRIAIARALATSPGLLLLDEPLSALDARVRVRLRGEIRSLQQRVGITTILVTHDQEEALSMADRIVVMNEGEIEQIGTPAEVYGRPRHAVRGRLRRQDQPAAGQRVGRDRVQVRSRRFECLANGGRLRHGAALRVFFRPEDVMVRGVNGHTPIRPARCREGRVPRRATPASRSG